MILPAQYAAAEIGPSHNRTRRAICRPSSAWCARPQTSPFSRMATCRTRAPRVQPHAREEELPFLERARTTLAGVRWPENSVSVAVRQECVGAVDPRVRCLR